MRKIKNFFISLLTAFSFLTILPIPFFKNIKLNEKLINNSIVFYPFVGLFYGLVIYIIAILLLKIKTDNLLISIIIIILPYIMNKFLHFDGLCDVADAFLSNRPQKERLKILKDSKIGSFALGTGIFFILIKLFITKIYIENIYLLPLLIIFPVFSRFGIIFMSYISKYPRRKGTAFFIIGKISTKNFVKSFLLFFFIILLLFIFFNKILYLSFILFQFAFMLLFIFIFRIYSNKKINGVTGDVLGAVIELLELFLPAITLILFVITNS